ncbi:MAG: flagellar export protein FliJ [Thermodesulfobacteriota bacterium]
MKPFKLQTVLDYRKRCEDAAQKRLIESEEKRSAALADWRAAEAEVVRLLEELKASKQNDVRIPELLMYEECIAFQRREAADLEKKLAEADEAVKARRAELVAARQEKRALELLKEKREAAERQRRDYQENKFLDEMAVIGFGGKR